MIPHKLGLLFHCMQLRLGINFIHYYCYILGSISLFIYTIEDVLYTGHDPGPEWTCVQVNILQQLLVFIIMQALYRLKQKLKKWKWSPWNQLRQLWGCRESAYKSQDTMYILPTIWQYLNTKLCSVTRHIGCGWMIFFFFFFVIITLCNNHVICAEHHDIVLYCVLALIFDNKRELSVSEQC